jgi:hypothetical protein
MLFSIHLFILLFIYLLKCVFTLRFLVMKMWNSSKKARKLLKVILHCRDNYPSCIDNTQYPKRMEDRQIAVPLSHISEYRRYCFEMGLSCTGFQHYMYIYIFFCSFKQYCIQSRGTQPFRQVGHMLRTPEH